MKHIETIDRTVSSLCREIDELQLEVEYWKELYTQEKADHNKLLNENLAQAKKNVGNTLLFALSTVEDSQGNLVIKKESRKVLSKQLITK